jgi:hypothetical protein
MGERALTKIQLGIEAVKGTAVAADTILAAGEHPPIQPDRVPTLMEDDVGVRAMSFRAPRIDQFLVRDTLSVPNAYYQLLPIFYSLGIKGNVTPVEQTGGEGDYLWTHTPSMTATNSPDSATIELGDDTQAYEAEYMMIERIRIQGVIAQGAEPSPQVIEIDYFARQHTPTTFTGALSLPSTEEINAKLTRFYIDTAWAGVGGTEKTGLLRSYDIEILTGLHPKLHGDQNQYFDIHGEGKFSVVSNFVLEGNSDADAIYDAMRAKTFNVLELNTSGSQIGAGDNHNQTIQSGGYWTNVIPLSENADGNNLHAATHEGIYDPTGATMLGMLVTTDVSAI